MISCIDRRVKRYSFGLVDLYKKFIILCRNEIGMLELVGQRFFLRTNVVMLKVFEYLDQSIRLHIHVLLCK